MTILQSCKNRFMLRSSTVHIAFCVHGEVPIASNSGSESKQGGSNFTDYRLDFFFRSAAVGHGSVRCLFAACKNFVILKNHCGNVFHITYFYF